MDTYEELYRQKHCSPEEIAARMEPGWVFWVDIALAQPKHILQAMGTHAPGGIRVHSMLDVYPFPWYQGESAPGIQGVSWFSGGGARGAVNRGNADVMPCYYRDLPELLRQNPSIDCICACVSPMDRHGYFSMGLTSSASADILTRAKHIFLEVNPNMPRSLSSPNIHISRVDALCENSDPLPETLPPHIDDVSRQIGNYIAAEVPDGATIQLGFGAIPDAVGMALKSKRNLGIHTELFTDSMVELILCGAVNNSRKPIHRGKSVATFAYATRRAYDYIDDNPAVELLPVDYVNDPKIIAQHPDFISVNAAVEVDLWGQVCAESIGTRHLSGSGGQVDYVRGAVESPGGKSFIAFPSTAQGGAVSRIRPTLSTGAIVTTGKNDVDYIVTEYGVAKLRGKTLATRAKALIAIAHPKFRDELLSDARRMNIML